MSMQIGNCGAMSGTRAPDLSTQIAPHPAPRDRPEPLLRQRRSGLALPLDYLGPIAEPAKAIADLTGAPIEIAFQSVLAMASLATQHLCDVEHLSGETPLSLFLLTVAASGERKSSCDRLSLKPVHDWEEAKSAAYRRDLETYKFELSLHEALVRKTLKSRAEEGGVVEGTTPQSPACPIVPRKVLSDITFEGLLRHFEDGDPSIGIFADEGGAVLRRPRHGPRQSAQDRCRAF
ncbi:DUF3987 domain-containing protein [Oceanicola granulosus]|uniref:DUF3987 domain-containing protein n=1 Tax=Oceanicola granulosus TaxID=252302 RepID=UPI000A05F5FA